MAKLKTRNTTNNIITFIYKIKKDDIFALGSQLAYSLLLSFFPFLIFLFTMAGYSTVRSEEVLISLKRILPSNAYSLIYKTIIEIFDFRNVNLLSFSFIVTIWIASNGFKAVIKALNKAYGEKEERSFLKLEFIAISYTFILAFLIIFSFFILVLGNLIGYKLSLKLNFAGGFNFIWNFLRLILALMLLIIAFAMVYKVGPSRKLTFREVFPGAVFATLGWVIVSLGFSFYVDNFANYSRLYGSIGTVIVLMVWLFLTSEIILIGGEINAILKSN